MVVIADLETVLNETTRIARLRREARDRAQRPATRRAVGGTSVAAVLLGAPLLRSRRRDRTRDTFASVRRERAEARSHAMSPHTERVLP